MRQYTEKIKSSDELYKVIYFIRNTFDADSLRLRASFMWITENISYDIEGFEKEDPRSSMLNYVVKNKKAVCGGYAGLLKFFCDAFNIESKVIYGTARTGKRDVNISQLRLRINHAWNAVKINNSWRLIDPTWAAGTVDDTDEENLKYYKDYKETYYFTPPEKLIFNHFPDQYQYQFLNKAIPATKFKKWPLFTTFFIGAGITEMYPDTSLIRVKLGDTVHFRIKTPIYSSYVCFTSENFKKVGYVDIVKKDGDWLLVDYPVTVLGNYNIYLAYCVSRISTPAIAIYRFEVN
ncbi:MAG TPA: transglutaminase domain-containing protein [Chitinophagaceae bacterium]|nr:transglutaminase domain-containing protein [Chitinophagaceae bacterium]